MRLLIILGCLICSTLLWAQPMSTVNEALMLEVANEQLAMKDYYTALEWFNKAYKEQKKKDPKLRLEIAKLHYVLRDYEQSEKWSSRIVTRDKKNEYPEALYYYGMSLKNMGMYKDAVIPFQQYLDMGTNDSLKARVSLELKGIKLAEKLEPNPALVISNAEEINTNFTEFAPLITENELYYGSFASKRVVILDSEEAGEMRAKIYIAPRNAEDGKISKGEPLGDNVNREGFQVGNPAISDDGQFLFFTRATLAGNELGESKLYRAGRTSEGWDRVEEVNLVEGDNIAKHPCMGELFGKPVMFFVSNMPGGHGGDDIYYATYNGDGTFDRAINLGEVINTPYDEVTPSYQDGTLFFSTDGRPTIGGLDIFKSTWDGTKWSEPFHLGMGYNSAQDDFGFRIDHTGYHGVFVSNRPSDHSLKSPYCCDDIWTIYIDPINVDVNTLVFDGSKKALSNATIQIIEMTNGSEGETASKTNEQSNFFNFPIKRNVKYRVIATKDGFYSDTLEINTMDIKKTTTLEHKLFLKEMPPPPPPEDDNSEDVVVETNQPIRLSNIYYDFDDDKILPDAEKDLNIILGLLESYPDMVLELGSHTDSRGQAAYNERLSQRRATSAKKWLTERGVSPERIVAVGYGESNILNQCTNGVKCSDEEHRFNRRTEFKIISGPTSIIIKRNRETGEIINTSTSSINTSPAPKTIIPAKESNEEWCIKWDDGRTFDFGKLKAGQVVKKSFPFTNCGKEDLAIEIATGSCGCTVPDWPARLIKSGETAQIDVIYDSKGKKGDQIVEVTIVFENIDSNGYPRVEDLRMTATVKE